MPETAFLTRQSLEGVFHELGLRARAADKIVEIAVYGGSALVLTCRAGSPRRTSMPS